MIVTAGKRQGHRLDWRAQTDAEGRFTWPDAPSGGRIDFDLYKRGYRDTRLLRDPGAAAQADLMIDSKVAEIQGIMNDHLPVIPDGMLDPADGAFGDIIDVFEPFAPN
ncbi:MAG: hypothetical protein ACLQGP_11100, partial [Isosphaeraceae bacterium]